MVELLILPLTILGGCLIIVTGSALGQMVRARTASHGVKTRSTTALRYEEDANRQPVRDLTELGAKARRPAARPTCESDDVHWVVAWP